MSVVEGMPYIEVVSDHVRHTQNRGSLPSQSCRLLRYCLLVQTVLEVRTLQNSNGRLQAKMCKVNTVRNQDNSDDVKI